jgi:DNA-binding MarR family transcriptional regulator
MTSAHRPDLAAMIVPLGRALTAAERPILAAQGLTMWGYVVLLSLTDEPVRTQSALAEAIGADKTRIIGDLDALQERGLVTRTPDPDDRRVRLIGLTAEGRQVRKKAQRAIQRGEDELLAVLAPEERRVFLEALQRLTGLPPHAFAAYPETQPET